MSVKSRRIISCGDLNDNLMYRIIVVEDDLVVDWWYSPKIDFNIPEGRVRSDVVSHVILKDYPYWLPPDPHVIIKGTYQDHLS